jgi:hypothetical protein
MLTEAQLAEFEASVKSPGASGGVFRISTLNSGTVQEVMLASSLTMRQLNNYQLSAEQ